MYWELTFLGNIIMASFGFLATPIKLGPPLIYLVGLLGISDPHINICVGPSNTCVDLKQFNLLPLTHCFEAISYITLYHIGLKE